MIDMQFSKFLHLYLFYHMVNFYSYVFENVYKIAFMCSTICACSNCGLVINSVCCVSSFIQLVIIVIMKYQLLFFVLFMGVSVLIHCLLMSFC